MPETLPATAARRSLRAVLERIGEIDAKRTHCGSEAESEAGEDGDRGREEQYPQVDGDLGNARDARRIPPADEPDAREGERETDGGGDAGEDQALGEQLPHHAESAGTERGTNRNLALAAFGAGEEEVRHVRAGDEQKKRDCAEEQPDGAADGAHDLVGERQHHRVELHLLRVQTLVGHRDGDAVQFVRGLFNRRSRFQAADGIEAVAAMVHAGGIHLLRQPQLRRLGILIIGRQDEARRHDAGDLVGVAVDLDGAADNSGVGGVAARPQGVAENDDVRTVAHVLGGGERPSHHCSHAERREQVRRDACRGHALRVAVAGEVHLPLTPGGDLAERLSPPPVVDDLAGRHPGLVERRPLAPDHHRPVGLAPRQRPQEDGVDDAEDGRVRADAEGQRQDRDGGERRVPAERTGAKANVLQGSVEKGRGHGVGLDGQNWPNVGRNAT